MPAAIAIAVGVGTQLASASAGVGASAVIGALCRSRAVRRVGKPPGSSRPSTSPPSPRARSTHEDRPDRIGVGGDVGLAVGVEVEVGDQGEGAGAGHCIEGDVAEAFGIVGAVDGVSGGAVLVPAAVAIAVGAGTQLAIAPAGVEASPQ